MKATYEMSRGGFFCAEIFIKSTSWAGRRATSLVQANQLRPFSPRDPLTISLLVPGNRQIDFHRQDN
jgi:hypothetical protein